MSVRGSCLCGGVTYEVSAPFLAMGHCHCSMCRKAHGAAFVTWGIVAAGSFRWTSGEDLVQRYDSSPGNARGFCGRCGASLTSEHGGAVGEVAVGTVDGDPGARPTDHIFVGSKASWHEITDALARHDAWPPGFGPDADA